MANDTIVLRFSDAKFSYVESKPVLDEVSFGVRNGAKVALMGQNGAGKSTLFKLILGEVKLNKGGIFVTPSDATIGIAKQVIPPEQMELTVRDWFATTFAEKPYNLDKRINDVLNAVNVTTVLTKKVSAHSGGQQARLLLAYALIQDPDILLLDEPTNNLDETGINHLMGYLLEYYLVDLPGYGFTRTSKALRDRLEQLINWYLFTSPYIQEKIVLIIDAHIGPQENDLEILRCLEKYKKNIIVVANKIDKIKKSEYESQLENIQEVIGGHLVIPYSAKKKIGVTALLDEMIF